VGRAAQTIPQAISETLPPHKIKDWNTSEFADALVVANLIGGWNEHCEADLDIIRQLLNGPFDAWQDRIRQVLQFPDSPLSVRNGIWKIRDRKELWQTLGPCVFDNHLDRIKVCSLVVLKERDPQFEVEPSERFAARIYGKNMDYSEHIRKGIAETLALLGSLPAPLSHCTRDKPDTVSVLVIRELFAEADWVLWGSLNGLLPVLAEASPTEFLTAVEKAIYKTPCPFDEQFAQEGETIFDQNYMTGLLWALEGIAWDAEHLVRTTVALGKLAERDPGGQWANSPADSLSTIFLPWLPQTTASIKKRKVAIKTLLKEFPDVAWKLLIELLPNQSQSSMGTHKPAWRNIIPEDWKDGVTKKDYWKQVEIYAELARKASSQDVSKLKQLVARLGNLPEPTFKNLLEDLSSEEVVNAEEEVRHEIWDALIKLVSRHQRFHDSDWALPADIIREVQEVAEKIKPTKFGKRPVKAVCFFSEVWGILGP
jgi:hypothetical protein